MDDFENEIDIKPIVFGYPCLICTEHKWEEESLSQTLTVSKNQKIFDLLCKALKVTWNAKNKKQRWDFRKEALPFCTSCLRISSDLLEILNQVQRLEVEFAAKSEHIRNLIVGSSQEGVISEHQFLGHDQNYEEKFTWFRKQVVGSQTGQPRKRGRPKKNPPLTVFPELRQNNFRKSVEDQNLTLRKSYGASEKTNATNASCTISEDLDDGHHLLEADDDFEPDYECKSEENVTNSALVGLFDVKPVLERIEIEPDSSELQTEEFESLNPGSPKLEPPCRTENPPRKVHALRSRKVTTKSKILSKARKGVIKSESETDDCRDPDFRLDETTLRSRKVKTKSKIIPKAATRRKCISKSESESDDCRDSDFRLDKADSSEEDGELNEEYVYKEDSVSRWKKNKNGKMFYDGIEVIPIENGYTCTKCDETVEGGKRDSRKDRMKHHIILKHLQRFPCPTCNKPHINKYNLDLHVKTVHEKSVIISCSICAKPFTTMMSMRRHIWSHQSEAEKEAAIASGKKKIGNPKPKKPNHQCRHCGKMFACPFTLKKHEEIHLDKSERPSTLCQICGAVYYSVGGLLAHMKTKHDHENKSTWKQCPHCPKKFPFQTRLNQHIARHTGEKPHKCPECGAGCMSKMLLNVHLNMHKDIRPHKCKDCDMAFFQKYHLRRHREVYHESENPPARKQSYRRRDGTRTPYIRKNKRKQQNPEEAPVVGTRTDSSPQSQAQFGTGQVQQLSETVDNYHLLASSSLAYTSSSSAYPYC